MTKVSIKSIVISPGRGRKSFTRIEELAASLKSVGFANPILVRPMDDGRYELIAGERRYRAALLAGFTEVPVTVREDISDLQYRVLELEENTCRVDLTWPEESELHRAIDELKRQQDPNWTQKQTAELVQLSPGHVSSQIAIAQRLREEPALVKEVAHLPIRAAMKVIENRDRTARAVRLQAAGQLQITNDYRQGDCRVLIRDLPDASVDLLLTDPPYGMAGLEAIRGSGSASMVGHQTMSDMHNMTIDEVRALLTQLAPQLYRVLKPGAHAYVFSSYQHIGTFIDALKPLEVQFPVLHWARNKSTMPGFGYNYLNRTEAIIMFHRPPAGRRLAKSMYNILEFDEVPSNIRRYPTEKPVALLRTLIEQSTALGDTVLDCFGGSGSTLDACSVLGRKGIAFEKNPDTWSRMQLHFATKAANAGAAPALMPEVV